MRRATHADFDAIASALVGMLKYSPAPQMKWAQPEVALPYVQQAIYAGHVWIMGRYAVMVDVGSDWYTSRKYLIEQIIIKLPEYYVMTEGEVSLDTVIRNGLGYLKGYYGCVATVAGDTQVGKMTPRYHAQGFITLGTQLYKE